MGKGIVKSLVEKYGSPLYVYDAAIIRKRFADLTQSITYPDTQIYYACKANTNVEILKLLRKEGAMIETVSKGEILAAFKAGYKPKEIIYTCSNITEEELKFVIDNNITINLDSLTQLKRFGILKPNSEVSIRINQGIGAGHHKHVITGGPESKFGIDISQIEEAKKMASKYKLRITGIHQHIGSNILDEAIFLQAMTKLLDTAKHFEDLKFIDFGGGFGIPYRPEEKPLNVKKLGEQITLLLKEFSENRATPLSVKFETGRYLVAESGMLLTTVTDIKKTPYRTFVGVDCGFNHLIRPAMYDAYHEIVNTSNPDGKTEIVSIAGNICESGDLFAKDRKISHVREGDILAILNAGAYGYSMSSTYNSRPKPAEILIDGASIKQIRERKEPEI